MSGEKLTTKFDEEPIYAHCYIDDKNIGGFPGWLACVEEIERMEEAYKTILKEDKTKV